MPPIKKKPSSSNRKSKSSKPRKEASKRYKIYHQKPLLISDSTVYKDQLITVLGNKMDSKRAEKIINNLFSKYQDNPKKILQISSEELQKIEGIGPTYANLITSALKLGTAEGDLFLKPGVVISQSKDVFNFFSRKLRSLDHEEFWVLYLNMNSQVIKAEMIARGGISETTVDQRLILRYAIIYGAVSIILCHNHPSGNVTPSKNDIGLTNQIKSSSSLMNIQVLDHLIIGGNDFTSLADKGLI